MNRISRRSGRGSLKSAVVLSSAYRQPRLNRHFASSGLLIGFSLVCASARIAGFLTLYTMSREILYNWSDRSLSAAFRELRQREEREDCSQNDRRSRLICIQQLVTCRSHKRKHSRLLENATPSLNDFLQPATSLERPFFARSNEDTFIIEIENDTRNVGTKGPHG